MLCKLKISETCANQCGSIKVFAVDFKCFKIFQLRFDSILSVKPKYLMLRFAENMFCVAVNCKQGLILTEDFLLLC